ncbi:TetR/AcrR family transcriptional regulator [Microbacterium sp.]|uniref:TetR/AcrR family transcriptional regulator n=1 Tax=Microbacterium sp. TaxID=51671 RepID=UPI0039E3F248
MTTTSPPVGAVHKPRGQYAKSAVKRREILDAALEVFAQSGYRAGSLRDVAQRAGMSEAGLLHHFRNKSVLLEAVLTHRDDRASRIVALDSGDGATIVRGLVELATYNASIPGLVELYCVLSAEATAPEHPAHRYFIDRYEFIRERVGNAFRALAVEGRLKNGMTPERAVVVLIALMDGLQVQWLYDRSIVDMTEALRSTFSVFVDIEW